MTETTPLVILNVAGLTPALLAHAPHIRAIGEARPLKGVFPALTMPAQATMLTGLPPSAHGVVGNGWFWRELGEVRNWVQSHSLMQAPAFYEGAGYDCARMFWWFNRGSNCRYAVTPKPHYGSDGSKAFDILSDPPELAGFLEGRLGKFPFHGFWGPRAGLPSSDWIANAAAIVIREKKPRLSLVYLPHLDYDLQRKGVGGGHGAHVQALVRQVDLCAADVISAAQEIGAKVIVVSEYGITDVSRVAYPNRILRDAGLLAVRDGPFGEMLDVFGSRAFAVCDHQAAHVYVREKADLARVAEVLAAGDGVARVLDRDAQREFEIDHERAGDLVLLSEPDAWFAYYYWLNDARAPDFARTIDIHAKPGYDPCELFLDPELPLPRLKVGLTLLKKKAGLRYRMNVIPLDATLVKGSHGLPPQDPQHGPIIVCPDLPDAPAMTDLPAIAQSLMRI